MATSRCFGTSPFRRCQPMLGWGLVQLGRKVRQNYLASGAGWNREKNVAGEGVHILRFKLAVGHPMRH